ncbi:MAG: GNAT family N-acetyltransferase [Lentimicrobium sp.]
MTTFQRTDSDNSDFQELVRFLDKDLQIRDGDEHLFYAQFNKIVNLRNVVVCYTDHQPVGCGAIKEFDQKSVEIKRMFVKPEYRNLGLGLGILKELELWASELKYQAAVLETGKKQPEAIKLYQKAGYRIIENFGQYRNVENSVCMIKDLT